MLVRLPAPYDFALSTERFRAFGHDLAYVWRDGGLHRVLAGREVRIEAADGGVRVAPGVAALAQPVARLLGAGFDLDGFARTAAADPVLGELATRLRGLRPPLAPDPFEHLVSSITAQQVSLRSALAIRNRLIERFSRPAGHAYPFPTRARLATASAEQLTALGFSRRKADYVLVLARADLDLDGLAALPDADVVDRLRALPGIGLWTAEWFLARHLGRPDVWPAGDLGLRRAVSAFYLDGRDAPEAEVRAVGERFAPHRTLAAQYLLTGMRVRRP